MRGPRSRRTGLKYGYSDSAFAMARKTLITGRSAKASATGFGATAGSMSLSLGAIDGSTWGSPSESPIFDRWRPTNPSETRCEFRFPTVSKCQTWIRGEGRLAYELQAPSEGARHRESPWRGEVQRRRSWAMKQLSTGLRLEMAWLGTGPSMVIQGEEQLLVGVG
jgi:hypothetical protein